MCDTSRWLLVLFCAVVPAVRTLRADEGGPSETMTAAFAPRGRAMVTGTSSADKGGTVILWDRVSGKPRQIRKEDHGVRCVTFSPDGKTLAVGGWDNLIKLCDPLTGKERLVLEGHSEVVNGLAFSPNGKLLASCSLDHKIKLWDVAGGKEIRTCAGHDDWVLAVVFFPDGKTIASASKGGKVKLWNAETGKELATLRAHVWGAEAIAVSPDGKTLATGGWDGLAKLWDVASREKRATLRGHPTGVLSVTFSPDGKTLATACGHSTQPQNCDVRLWDVASGKLKGAIQAHSHAIWCVRFTPDGRSLVTGSRDDTVKVWELATLQGRMTLRGNGTVVEPAPKTPFSEEQLAAYWNELAADSPRSYKAMGELLESPAQAIGELRKRLQPAPALDAEKAKRLTRLIADLDSDDFATREKATAEISRAGEAAVPVLRKAAAGSASAEVRRRLDNALAKFNGSAAASEGARLVRAVELLELLDSAPARQLLEALGKGAPEARLTVEANAALARIGKPVAAGP